MEESGDTDSPPPAQLPGWSKPVVVPWSNHPTTDRVLRLLRSRDTYWGNYINCLFHHGNSKILEEYLYLSGKNVNHFKCHKNISGQSWNTTTYFPLWGPCRGNILRLSILLCVSWCSKSELSSRRRKNNCIILYHISSDRIYFEYFTINYFIT